MYIRIYNVNESKNIKNQQTPSTYYNSEWQLAVDLFMFFDTSYCLDNKCFNLEFGWDWL